MINFLLISFKERHSPRRPILIAPSTMLIMDIVDILEGEVLSPILEPKNGKV